MVTGIESFKEWFKSSEDESSASTHICIVPSRYNLAYSSGSSMASAFNAQSDPGVVFKSFRPPNSQCEAYNQHLYKYQCCFVVDCILQILFSSYRISLSFNQSFATKIRSISISSPCHFYFVLYCFIDFSFALVFALIRVRKHWWDDITQGKQ